MDLSPPVKRLVMVGACYIDTILSVPHYPSEDSKLRATALSKRRGGNGGNTLEVLQQLISPSDNLNLSLLCVLPSSSSQATTFVKESFSSQVDLSLCINREDREEAACSFIIKAMDTASRTIVNYIDLPEMTTEEFQKQVKGSKEEMRRSWFHFEGRIPETCVACIKWLRDRYSDVLISVEVEKPGRDGLELMASEADVVFFSKSWAQGEGYQDVKSFLSAQSHKYEEASLLCATWGELGAAVIVPETGVYHHEPAQVHSSLQIVDTVGAGDTFIAGMLYKLLAPGVTDVKDALAFANQLAGRKVLQDGFAHLA